MSNQPNRYARRVLVTVVGVGVAAIITGLLLAVMQSTAPYTWAGGLIALGMFILGIGVGGALFTPREAVAVNSQQPGVNRRPR